MTPMQRTYEIAREAANAQQDVIREMREQIEELCVERVELREAMRHMIRLDDPVVTGLVEALKSANKWVRRIDDRQDDLPGSFIPFGTDPSGSVRGTRAALSAYEARVKEVSRE